MKKILKGCITVASILAGTGVGAVSVAKVADKALKGQEKQTMRVQSYYEVLNQWILLKNKGVNLEQFFKKNNYNNIAIYGFAELGKRLEEELDNSNVVSVAYIIDQNPNAANTDKDAYLPSNELPPVDAVVVTPVFAFHEIHQRLSEMISCPILSIEDVLTNCD